MNLQDYQKWTPSTALYPEHDIKFSKQALNYLSTSLGGEAGELGNTLKKVIRDKNGDITESRESLLKESGDFLYYMSQICNTLDFDLEDFSSINDINLELLDADNKNVYTIYRYLFSHVANLLMIIDDYISGHIDRVQLLESDTLETFYEIGFYLQAFVRKLGYTIEEVAETNNEKLESRKERGVLQGSGDNR